MTSVKIKFKALSGLKSEGCLYYQVSHQRVVRRIKTNYMVTCSVWEKYFNKSTPVSDHKTNGKVSENLVVKRALSGLHRLEEIVRSLESHGDYTVDDVVSRYESDMQSDSFFDFMFETAMKLKELGHVRTSEAYLSAYRSFRRFIGTSDILFDEIDADLMMYYESYLKQNHVSLNSISFYMRIMRAVYNRAVEKNLVTQQYPFKHVYTGVEKTMKRAIPFKYIKRLKNLDIPARSSTDFARDMFLFSFYTRGMSFVDMSYLRKTDLRNGVLAYRRRKTGQQLFIKWERCMQDIIDKYPSSDINYLLPIITKQGDERKQYENALHLVNHKLKSISKEIGLEMPLSMYVARHSWASIARDNHIPITVISEGLGHDSEVTTRIYLSSLDNSVIDKANKLILKKLL